MTKSLIAFIVFALTFACVLSCDEQSEKLEAQDIKRSISSPSQLAKKNNRVDAPNFDGSEGDPIDLAIAKEWAANFRTTLKNPDEIQGHYFGSEIIRQILDEEGCVGIRIYYAIDNSGERKLLLVGVDSNGDDLLPSEGGKIGGDGYTIADFSYPCPTYCSGGGGGLK